MLKKVERELGKRLKDKERELEEVKRREGEEKKMNEREILRVQEAIQST